MRFEQLGLGLLLLSCGEDPLQRMREQPRFQAYQGNAFYPDGRAMRPLVEGTVPRETELTSPTPGSSAKVNRATLEQGRHLFDIVCATCHGLLGDGKSAPARSMALRPPPSLHAYRSVTDQHLFEVIGQGYGLMPAFTDISPMRRWAVVAYVRALQLSQHATLDQVPEGERRALEQETP